MTGEYCERLLNPYVIAGTPNGAGIKPLSRLLFDLRAYFIVVGTKE